MTVATALVLAGRDNQAPSAAGDAETTAPDAATATSQRPTTAPSAPAPPSPKFAAGGERTTPPPGPAPAAPEVPKQGSGTFIAAQAPPQDETSADGAFTYTVEVEAPLTYPAAQVAAVVDRTLADRRGWSAQTDMTFQRVASGPGTRILLATPATVDRLCAPLQTNGQVSCRNGDLVVLNALRWAEGSPSYGDDVTSYRRYLINHEVGHRLGRQHQTCPQPGAPAPLMAQQTKGLQGCKKNPWP